MFEREIGNSTDSLSKNYLLGNDITLTSDWEPIGTEKEPFTGSYNGNGFEIKGLTMKNPYAQIIGLFGVADGTQIYKITMRDYDILLAGVKAANKDISPILVYGNGNTSSYDNSIYPKENSK